MKKLHLIITGAIVLLLILVVILVVFNKEELAIANNKDITETTDWVPGRCFIVGDFSCENYVLDKAGYLSLDIKAKEELIVSEIKITSRPSSDIMCEDSELNIEFQEGEIKTLTFSCADSSVNALDADIEIKYSYKNNGISRIQMGDIVRVKAFSS